MRFGRQSDGNAIENASGKFANAPVGSGLAEGYLLGGTRSHLLKGGVTITREGKSVNPA